MDRLARALLDASRSSASALSPAKGNLQRPSSLLPPPPRIGISAGSQVLRAAQQVAPPPAPVKQATVAIPQDMGRMASIAPVLPAPRREQAADVETWGVYDTPYGPVAMPQEYGERNEYRLMGDPITDPQQIERARNSSYAWDKLPEEQQAEIQPPSMLETTANATGDTALNAARRSIVEAEARKVIDSAARTGTMGAKGGVDAALTGMAGRARQAETAFAVVRNTQTNTTELVTAETVENAPPGFFEVITPNVSAEEAQVMIDAGVLQEGQATLSPETVDVEPARALPQMRADAVKIVDGEAVPPGTEPGQYQVRIGTPDAEDLPDPPEGYMWVVKLDGAPQPGQSLQARLVPLGQDGEGNWIVPELPEGVMIVKAPDGVALPQADRGPLDATLDFFANDPVGTVGRGIEATIEALPGGEALTDSTLPELVWGARYVWNRLPLTGEIGGPTASDVATSVWDAEIPGTNVSLGSIGEGIWNFDLPGTGTSIGDVLTAFFEYVQMPGDDALLSITDALYARATGNAVDSETQVGGALGRVPLIGDFLENMYESGLSSDLTVDAADAVLGKPYVDWVQGNESTFVDLYENGYDIDDDGEADVFGSDATLTYWLNEEASALEALYVLTMMDPLTWAGAAGLGGKVIIRGGKVIRMADNAGPVRQTVGRIVEGVGQGVHITGRTLEGIGDLGAEYVLRGLGWGLSKTGVTGLTASSRRAAEGGELGDVVVSTVARDRVPEGELVYDSRTGRVTNADGAEILDESVPVGTVIQTDFHDMTIVRTERGWDLVTTDANGVTTRRRYTTAEAAWRAAERSGTRATGESGGGRWERAAKPEESAKFIDQVPVDGYRTLKERLGPQWAQSEEILAGMGRGIPRPEHALESSRIARVTIDTAADAGIPDLPEWSLNTAHYLSPYYETMETAIRTPWSEGAAARSFLDGTGQVTRSDGLTVRSNGAVISAEPVPLRGRIPQERVRQANNYVDLISEHAKWHPADFSDASFADAFRRAVEIDDALRARGKRTYPDLRPPLRDTAPAGFEPVVATTPTNAPGPDVARAVDTPEPEVAPQAAEDIRSRYPVDRTEDVDGHPLNVYDLGDGQLVEVAAIPRADVPVQWQRQYPDYEGNRFYAAMAKPHSEVAAFAPTEAEALGLVEETLRARGYISGEGGLDVLAEVDASAPDVIRFNVGRDKPPTRLVVKALPQAGESRMWHGIEISADTVDGLTVYTAQTPGGPFSFVRQAGKAMPVSVEDGTLTRLTFDRGRAVSLREMGDHLYLMDRMEPPAASVRTADEALTEEAVPSQAVDSELAPEVEATAPEAPQADVVDGGMVESAAVEDGATPVFREKLYHGSPNTELASLSANPPGRQFDNATSVWGVFFTADPADARRYAGDAGRIYDVDVALSNPYEMEYREFSYYQDITKNADRSPAPDWNARQAELIEESRVFRDELIAEGHDGIVVRKRNGDIMEVAVFNDVPLAQAAPPLSRMTPEARRQRIQRIRGSRAKAGAQTRRTRAMDPQAYTRAVYGDVETQGGVTVEQLNPNPTPSQPPTETAPDPTGTVQIRKVDFDALEAENRRNMPQTNRRPAPNSEEAAYDNVMAGRKPWEAQRTPTPEAERAVSRVNGKDADWTPRETAEPRTGGAHRVSQKASGRMPARLGFIEDQGMHRWLDRPITNDEVEVLTRHTFRDGKPGDTVLERVQLRAREAAEADNYRLDMIEYERKAIRETLADYEELLKQIYPDSRIPQRVKRGIEKLPKPVQDGLEAVAAVLRKVLGAWDTGMQYARERMLFSHMKQVSYPMTQAIGNSTQLVLGGQGEAFLRMWKKDAWWESRKAILRGAPTPEDAIRLDPGLTPSQRMHAQLGTRQGREITSIYHGMHGKIDDPLVLERALKNVPGGRALAKLSGSKKVAVNGAMFDASVRDALDVTYTMRHLKTEAIPDFRNKTIINLMEWGMSREEARRLWREFTQSVDGPFYSMNDVTRFFSRHVDQGKATRIGRDWQAGVNKAEKLAREAVRKYAFAGDATRADLVLSRVFLFHHFMTRQSNYYLNLMARHPYMINLYFNVKEELEQHAEGWPPYLQGWVRLFGTPMGFQLFLNPTALMSSYLIFNDSAFTFSEEQMTRPGYWAKRINDVVGLNPLLMQGLNMTGFFGEDFAPDPLFMWREASLITQVINWGRAHGYIGDDPTPVGNWYEQENMDLREVFSKWNPWADTVEARSSEARMDREVNMLIADELERDGIDPESPEGQAILRDAMADPDSAYYQRAVKRWTNGEIMETATRFVIGPFLPRQRPVNEEGKDLYHSFSRELKAIVNTSDPRAIAIREQEGGYYDLGTERDNEIAKLWNQVAYGDVHHPVTVDGVTYSPEEVYRMTSEQRVALANGLLAEYGLIEEYAALQERQDVFLAQPENAEYAQFRTWAKAVRDYEGGIDAYWEDAAANNEDARRYYEYVNSLTLLPWERERRLTNMSAFMGLTGIQPSVWDPAPAHSGPVSTIYDPVDVANRAPEPIPYQEPNAEFREAVREAPVQMAEMEAWDAEIKAVQQELGIDPSIPFNELDYDTRKTIEDTLEERGVYEPEVTWQVKQYLEWAEQQPRGADTSIEAFFAWSDREYRRTAPGRVQEKLNEVQPEAGPDARGATPPSSSSSSLWKDMLDLLHEHDHRMYPKTDGSSGSSSGTSNYWLFDHLP